MEPKVTTVVTLIPDTDRDLLDLPIAAPATVGSDGRPQRPAVLVLAGDDTIRRSLKGYFESRAAARRARWGRSSSWRSSPCFGRASRPRRRLVLPRLPARSAEALRAVAGATLSRRCVERVLKHVSLAVFAIPPG